MSERRTNPKFRHSKHRFYDQLSRLIEADYNFGDTVYDYGYDVAGNMVNYDGVTRTYNAANQMTNDGTNTLVYDNNGNMTSDGIDTYTWDSANRLLSVGNHSYVYDGLGNRVQQTVSSVVTDYLNDVQPSLTKLLKQDDGTTVNRFVHGVRGIHAVDDGTDWNFYTQDGLGSVRAVVDDMAVVQSSMSYDPYGNPMGAYGDGFGFTGEQTDENGSVFLRARYYEPSLGTFSALDPWEGIFQNSRTLNGYDYVWGNPINRADASGMCSQATREAGRQAGLALRYGTDLANMGVDGAIPELVSSTFCAAEDFGPTVRNLAVSGTQIQIATTYVAGSAGTAAGSVVIAATGLGLLVGVAFGLSLYINYLDPVFYTPDQLEDMRPPTPTPGFTPTPGATINPVPTGTQPTPSLQPEPFPAPAPDRVGDPVRVNDPCPDDDDDDNTTIYRVQSTSQTDSRNQSRQRILIDASGNISIPDKYKKLYIWLRSYTAAQRFLLDNRKVSGTEILAFEVPESVAGGIELASVPQDLVKSCGHVCTEQSDHEKYGPYGYGLRTPWIMNLEFSAIPGSGRIVYKH